MRTAQLVAAPAVVAIIAAGVWLAGGVITDDFRLAMALTAVWMAASAVACIVLAVRHRPLRVPVLAAWVLAAGGIGAFLALGTVVDRTVDERVATAPPTATGELRSGEHATSGRAAVVDTGSGRVLTLTEFETAAGPDLRVRLVPGRSTDGGADGALDLGGLKGNRGDQQYRVPAGARVDGATLVIWCRAFSVDFGSARLSAV